jgi:hypothetical protein
VNQRAPSGPATIPTGALETGYSLKRGAANAGTARTQRSKQERARRRSTAVGVLRASPGILRRIRGKNRIDGSDDNLW